MLVPPPTAASDAVKELPSDVPGIAPRSPHEEPLAPVANPPTRSSRPHAPDVILWNSPVPVTRAALYFIGGLILGVGIISFVLGWAMGSSLVQPQLAAAANSTRHTISGQITYQTSNGRIAADTESVVIALPKGQRPDEKFAITTLRPETPQNLPRDPVYQAIRSLGGDMTRTNRTGDFELVVPSPGDYYVLMISAHHARDRDQPPTTKEIVELGYYFQNANELLGNNDFWWTEQLVRTSKTLDRLFGRNQNER